MKMHTRKEVYYRITKLLSKESYPVTDSLGEQRTVEMREQQKYSEETSEECVKPNQKHNKNKHNMSAI